MILISWLLIRVFVNRIFTYTASSSKFIRTFFQIYICTFPSSFFIFMGLSNKLQMYTNISVKHVFLHLYIHITWQHNEKKKNSPSILLRYKRNVLYTLVVMITATGISHSHNHRRKIHWQGMKRKRKLKN